MLICDVNNLSGMCKPRAGWYPINGCLIGEEVAHSSECEKTHLLERVLLRETEPVFQGVNL